MKKKKAREGRRGAVAVIHRSADIYSNDLRAGRAAMPSQDANVRRAGFSRHFTITSTIEKASLSLLNQCWRVPNRNGPNGGDDPCGSALDLIDVSNVISNEPFHVEVQLPILDKEHRVEWVQQTAHWMGIGLDVQNSGIDLIFREGTHLFSWSQEVSQSFLRWHVDRHGRHHVNESHHFERLVHDGLHVRLIDTETNDASLVVPIWRRLRIDTKVIV